MTPKQVETFFASLQKANPEPKTELHYTNPFTMLTAVVLSAQATDKSVNKATDTLFRVADTPEKLLALGEEGLTAYVKTIGLYRSKVKNLRALSQRLIDCYGGQVPRDREALESLPGVGRKTANVVRNVVFGEKTVAVDTHVFRVSNRTGLAPGKDAQAVEAALMAVIPDRFLQHAHHWLVLHGRYVCTARKPHCPACPVRADCGFAEKDVG